MLSIRLTRIGKKKQPSYRVIVVDKKKDPWGKYLENLGFYNPRTNPKTIDLKVERIKYWISKGAQASATVNNMLVDAGILTTKVKSSSAGKKSAEAPKTEAPKAEAKPKKTEMKPETPEVKPEIAETQTESEALKAEGSPSGPEVKA
jgi:small subunit ribosomal protein S16